MTTDKMGVCAVICAAVGALIYALLAFSVIMPQPYPYFGVDIYNAYFYRLLDGRFDLPLRMLTFEGHYSADGTAILYHGIAPLLTRLVLYPFVALEDFPTAAFSIWLWSVVGTGFYHLALFQVIRKYMGQIPLLWVVLMAVAIWVSSPGFLLTTNTVLYHEPTSIAYAAMAIAVYLMVRCALFGLAWRYVLIPTALMAGVLLHARPHMAVGLYAGVAVMIALALWENAKGTRLRVFVSIVILGLVGASFLQFNSLRFGSATSAHGQIEMPDRNSQVQYGPVFLGNDASVTGRLRVFVEHGRFHPWRVLPNTALYIFDFPPTSADTSGGAIATLHRSVTEGISGYGFIEAPRFGMVFIWPAWIVLMVIGLGLGRPRLSGGPRALPVLIATGIAAGLMLAYPTVAFRYRFDVWPVVMALCLLSLPGLIQRFGPELLKIPRVLSMSLIIVVFGVFMSGRVAIPYKQSYQQGAGQTYETWDADRCLSRLATKDFSPERLAELCVDPETVFQERQRG
ncbi:MULTISPECIES: hypothetical protein [unclassified Yoonia]|uniref:hypothetical protein n=1 Tax=unclassified Yoonia TaxID=2629118 RepID=UPI002AFE8007|nr:MULTISPECIES: hypothetical protein [unclassified Yoonia]